MSEDKNWSTDLFVKNVFVPCEEYDRLIEAECERDSLKQQLAEAHAEIAKQNAAATLTLSTPVPEYLLRLPPIEPLPDNPIKVKPGQVWLAKDAPGILLVVESLENPDGYACYPIAEETAYLSDKDVWLDKGATRFGKPMMVQTWLDVSTDRAGLARYIGELSPETLQSVLRLRAGTPTEGDKHMSGPPLTGEDDPLYEYQRQQIEFWQPASARLMQRVFDADEIADFKTQLTERDAALAEMRKALNITLSALPCALLCAEKMPDGSCALDERPCKIEQAKQRIIKALSSSAGRDLLERVRYLEQGHQLLKDLLDDVYMLDPMGSGNRVLSGPPKRSLVDTVDTFLKAGGKDA